MCTSDELIQIRLVGWTVYILIQLEAMISKPHDVVLVV